MRRVRGYTWTVPSGCGPPRAPKLAGEVAGVAAADSWATDAHKWLNTTYDSGIALVRDGEALRAAMRAEASYLPPGDGRDPMNFTPQSSQRARGAEAWAVLAALGRGGVSRLVGGHVTLARRFASGLAAGGLDILNEVRLNQVVAACRDAEATEQMIAALQREGTCWCGPDHLARPPGHARQHQQLVHDASRR